ncbi:hypothetical protein PR048_018840 [Dryococelus australis]|uniref:MADF domain-containing protein n=1 Tax=Dryococelus australis TaxID=614101 RepID=A0ABQ9H1T2_9NEOP|nr:hypothetical protein PR048_018840 [Dryococelus australis]
MLASHDVSRCSSRDRLVWQLTVFKFINVKSVVIVDEGQICGLKDTPQLQRVWGRTEQGRQPMLVRSVREWNVMREELVSVKGVEDRPMLWDVYTTEYRDRCIKHGALKELAKKDKTEIQGITRKIHNLSNQFNSEFKKSQKNKSGQGTDEKYVSSGHITSYCPAHNRLCYNNCYNKNTHPEEEKVTPRTGHFSLRTVSETIKMCYKKTKTASSFVGGLGIVLLTATRIPTGDNHGNPH